MIQTRTDDTMTRTPIADEKLFRIGFHLSSLPMLSRLSGLVEIQEIVVLPEHDTLSLVIKNNDETGILFGEGSLKATPIPAYQPHPQDLMVEWDKGRAKQGGN